MKGKIHNETDRAGLIEHINRLDISRPYSWEVKRYVKRRSLSANNLYWLWLAVIADDTGEGIDALHEAFKQMFLIPRIVTIGDKEISVYSTKWLNTAQFSEYMERVSAEAAGIGIMLPSPDDLIFDSFVEQYKDRM